MSTTEKQKTEYQEKLKAAIKLLVKQVKSGCGRRACYNSYYCANAPERLNDNPELFTKNDQALVSACLAVIKQEKYIESLNCLQLNVEGYYSKIVKSFDEWFTVFSDVSPSNSVCINSQHVLNFWREKTDFSVYSEIKEFNKAFTEAYNILKLRTKLHLIEVQPINQTSQPENTVKYNIRGSQIFFYLVKIYSNFLITVLLSKSFLYNIDHRVDLEHLLEGFSLFLNEYKTTSEQSSQIIESKIVSIFTYIDTDSYKAMINTLQDFLTVLLIDLTQKKISNSQELVLLVGLMRLIDFLHFINTNKNYANKEIFYNHSVNHYLSIKHQCLNYFKYHKKNFSNDLLQEADVFSFLKYYYMYDTGSKKEIISHYNSRIQTQEAISSSAFLSIDNILSGMGGIYLVFKIKREKLVENTLDLISTNLNFRKPLRVIQFNYYILGEIRW